MSNAEKTLVTVATYNEMENLPDLVEQVFDTVPQVDLLVIENVGNLVCTAGFNLGEHLRIVVLSTAEGDDKAAKYPAIFQSSHALFITKCDLLPHVDFDPERIMADFQRLAPQSEIFQVAALKGNDIPPAADWLAGKCATVRR